MAESNAFLREEMKKVVKNQIRQNEPPETKQTYDRLIEEGFPEEEVFRMLATVVTVEIYDVMKSEKPFNQERFIRRLQSLPE